jgi:hypothetical protein
MKQRGCYGSVLSKIDVLGETLTLFKWHLIQSLCFRLLASRDPLSCACDGILATLSCSVATVASAQCSTSTLIQWVAHHDNQIINSIIGDR